MQSQAQPQLRSQSAAVTAVLLGAGSSKRFGENNKLLALRDGCPLIHHALESITRSQVQRLVVVLGHDASSVRKHCEQFYDNTDGTKLIDIEFIVNTDFESGMASSLRTGISCLLSRNLEQTDAPAHAALVCLADMPVVKPQTINALLSANSSRNSNSQFVSAFVPTHQHARGNPVLLMPELFDLLLDVAGDVGARHVLQANPDSVQEVAVDDAGIFIDCDTPEQLTC